MTVNQYKIIYHHIINNISVSIIIFYEFHVVFSLIIVNSYTFTCVGNKLFIHLFIEVIRSTQGIQLID